MNLNFTEWQHIFKVAKQICRKKEFHYKFLYRIIVTKKKLCHFGIKQDSDCLYCGLRKTPSNILILKSFPAKSYSIVQ